MAENSKFGREPIQVVQIDQDFCTRTFGDITTGCTAGNQMQMLVNSIDTDDTDFFFVNINSTTGLSPDGVSKTQILDSQDMPSSPDNYGFILATRVDTNCGNMKSDDPPLVYFTFLARRVSGTATNEMRAEIEIWRYDSFQLETSGNGFFNPVDGTFGAGFGANYSATSVDEGNGWFRYTFAFQVTSISTNGYVAQFNIDAFELVDAVYEVGEPSITFGESFPYLATNGNGPIYPTSTTECFNTRSTCVVPDVYDKGVLSLSFVDKRAPLPFDDYYIPSLTTVKVTPARLNPGGANRNAGALGERASININFRDHPHNDRLVDKYRDQRPYDPKERGTFWTKWRARNPYYMQRPIKLRSGYLKDGAIVEEITRDFVITGFSGPDAAGNVQIQGKDILTLAEDEKAQAPVASQGKLAADITAGATSATLTPAGIGDAEYPASGQARIGKEVVSFTRSGDVLTITRGQFGTDAKAHDEDDLVQLCLRYVSQAPQDILEDLLTNYANIPAQYIDKAQWDAEALDFLPRLYTAIITEPQGVSKLISEMCQQMYFTIWWDERLGKIVLKSVRLAQEDEVFELDDDKHLIADSIAWKDLADELITQVWVYYGQIDPTEKIDQGSNYSTIAITADPEAEGPDKHNLRRIKTIFSRWIDATNASAAEDLGARILDRYGNAPRQVTFRVDAKDDYLWLGEYIRLSNRLRVDRFGQTVPVNLQIFEAEEATLGSEYKFTAQEFIPALIGGDEIGDPNVRTIPITSDLLNVNLRTLHDSLFGTPDGTETVTFIVREGVTVGGDSAGGGTNVAIGQRVTTNDFYSGGNSLITGASVGTLPILQRASIGSPRTILAGASYESLGDAAYDVNEYPTSIAVETGTWPVGVTLNLVLESSARILGQAGNGSAHHVTSGVAGYDASGQFSGSLAYVGIPGGDGGDALKVDYDISITNGGTISAGGAGGGSCNFKAFEDGGNIRFDGVYGGGGAGLFLSSIKENLTFDDTPVTSKETFSERQAAVGSQTIGGIGGKKDHQFGQLQRIIQVGGRSGNLNASGQNATLSVTTFLGGTNTYSNVGNGGAVGKAVSAGASMITWVNKGDVRGAEVA